MLSFLHNDKICSFVSIIFFQFGHCILKVFFGSVSMSVIVVVQFLTVATGGQ